jgi:formylglycine-generating enzyme
VTVPNFRLDKYEATVPRFREYLAQVDAWQAAGNPLEGAGAHPQVPESGWRKSWESDTWPGALDVVDGLKPVWVDTPEVQLGHVTYALEGTDELAANHLPWQVAFAFCIWDGGRLPANVELAYAAAGGAENRTYAWGGSPTWESVASGRPEPVPLLWDVPDNFWKYVGIPVGSAPATVGKFGHEDLMTGMWEVTRDTRLPSGASPTGSLIELIGDETLETSRMMRGGSWETAPRDGDIIYYGMGTAGVRCARNP